MRIEEVIISQLLHSEDYLRKIGPFIKPEYFSIDEEKCIIESINNHFIKYHTVPTKEVILIDISKNEKLSENTVTQAISIVESSQYKQQDIEWLHEESEKFCRDRAVINAIYESIVIANEKKNIDGIPKLLEDALAVSFNRSIGHDYFDDVLSRYEFYHREEEKLKFGIHLLDLITNGGLSKKTLTCLLAGTGTGKSLAMCSWSAYWLSQGKNVLYITLEMAEEKIAERIDANLFNIPIQDIKHVPKDTFDTKIEKIREKTRGKLIIKEYPTASAHAGHFRALAQDLKQKKNFVPDVVCIDYINLCLSQRVKNNNSANSYTIIKNAAEEIRGLAMELDVPIVTATQVIRSGLDSSDLDMSDTSESIGLAFTLDLYLAMISTEELGELGQVMFKQLKNRYGDISYYRKFVVGVDKERMKLYNLESSAQDNIVDSGKPKSKKPELNKNDTPVFDRGKNDINFGGFK